MYTPITAIEAYKRKISNKLFGVIHLKPKGSVRGTVLLSYLTEAFTLAPWEEFSTYHTSYWECHEIAETFLRKGYAVDVIKWENKTFVPKKKYDFFIDMHHNLERLAPLLGSACKKILHIAICHWIVNNTAEYQKLKRVYEKRGVALKPRRVLEPTLNIENADLATVLGNKFTQDTYRYAGKPIHQIPISVTVLIDNPKRDYSKAKNNFLWIGGGGAALKGLDVTLEAFAAMPDKKLFICGGVSSEQDFQQAYWKELYQTPNIVYLDRVDVGGEKFKEVVKECAFVLYPSTSEGQAGSIVQAMHAGLIPLISYQTGVDVHDFGKILPDNSLETVTAEIKAISALPEQTLEQMGRKTWEFVRTHHTRETFSAAYEKFATDVLRI